MQADIQDLDIISNRFEKALTLAPDSETELALAESIFDTGVLDYARYLTPTEASIRSAQASYA